jgi:hypothetical protein
LPRFRGTRAAARTGADPAETTASSRDTEERGTDYLLVVGVSCGVLLVGVAVWYYYAYVLCAPEDADSDSELASLNRKAKSFEDDWEHEALRHTIHSVHSDHDS